jgi:hypothetical protein
MGNIERAYDLADIVAAHRAACSKRGTWVRLSDMEYDAIAGTVLRAANPRGAVSAASAARAAWQAFTEDRAEEADVDVAFDALDATLGGQ